MEEQGKLASPANDNRGTFSDEMSNDRPPRRPNHHFSIRHLGPVESAEIELHPLTLFVGENNSGKSWIAATIWGMHQWQLLCFESRETLSWNEALTDIENLTHRPPAPEGMSDSVKRWLERTQERANLTEVVASVSSRWAEWTENLHTLAIKNLLAAVGLPHSAGCSIRCPQRTDPIYLWNEVAPANSDPFAMGVQWIASETIQTRERLWRGLTGESRNRLPSSMSNMLFPWADGWPQGSPAYLPASRTGFIQMLPAVSQQLMGDSSTQPTAVSLNAQQKWFARLGMTLPAHAREAQLAADLADSIEYDVLSGKFTNEAKGFGRFDFVPNQREDVVPSSAVSSVITEMAPLVRLFRMPFMVSFLVLEEPEAHLHPKLQRKLANVLVRLVNRGVRLLLTTHSTFIVQQINICIKLGVLRTRMNSAQFAALLQKLNMVDEECLTPADVAGYEFNRTSDGVTAVTRLRTTAGGVVVPTFNKDLIELNEELDLLDAAFAENGAEQSA